MMQKITRIQLKNKKINQIKKKFNRKNQMHDIFVNLKMKKINVKDC